MAGDVITLFELIILPAFIITLVLAFNSAIRRSSANSWLVVAVIAAPALGWFIYGALMIRGLVGQFIHVVLLLPLIHPLLLFLLASTFWRLPRYSRTLAALSYLAVALFTLVAGPAISLNERLIIFGYLVGAEALVAVLFLHSARGHVGIMRRRLQIIGVANLATIAATTFSGMTIGRPPLIFAQLTALVTLLSMIGHLIGFAPPLWLRRIWQRYELESFLRGAARIPAGQDLNAIFDLLETSTQRAMAPRATALLRREDGADVFRLVRPGAYVPVAPLRLKNTSLHGVIREQKPAIIPLPAGLDPSLERIAHESGSMTAMVVPIATDTELWGIFIAFTGYQPLFAVDELPQLHLLVQQCALLIDYGETLAQEKKSRHRAETLARIARTLEEPEGQSEGRGGGDPLTIFCAAVARVLGVPMVALRQFDPAAGELKLTHHYGVPRSLRQLIGQRSDSTSPNSPDRRSSRILIIPDLKEADTIHRRDALVGLGVRTVVTVSMSRNGQLIGDLTVATLHETRTFSADDLDLIQALAAQATGALTNLQLLEQLRGYAAELEEKVATRTRDLQVRNEELDAFAHTVAHDLKEPVSNIMGFGNILLDEPNGLTEEARNYVEIMVRNSTRMERIIDELLLLANVRRADVIREPVDMTVIVLESLARLDTLRARYDAKIDYPLSWPAAMGYAPWLEEVWANYISNAINYGRKAPEVVLSAEVLGDGYVRFYVQDNGRGLSPEEQATLFSANTESLRVDGHGFGLSIVRRIVEKLDGRVGVQSEVGEGSTFWFDLPQAERDAASL